MAKYVLQIDEPTPDYVLMGISCHQKDYRAAWAIGSALGFEFTREDDLYTVVHKNGAKANFSSFSYTSGQEDKFILLSNKSESGTLLPELNQFDYILLIYSLLPDEDIQDMMRQIRANSLIQYCSMFNAEQMKHASRLPIF